MVSDLCFDLRADQKLTSCVTVKIRYANFDTHTQQKRIPYTSFDHTILEVVKDLFKKLYNRRMMLRLIGVRLSHLVHGTQQLNLFEDTPEKVNLYLSLDRIRKRYGKHVICRVTHMEDLPSQRKIREEEAEKEGKGQDIDLNAPTYFKG